VSCGASRRDAPAATWTLDEGAGERGTLVGRLTLTDPKGNPLCASVRPPLIAWSAATE